MVVKVPKSSPSLVSLTGSRKNIKSYILPKRMVHFIYFIAVFLKTNYSYIDRKIELLINERNVEKYVVGYEDIAAFKRREKCGYEEFICKITAIMLEQFVDYLKKDYCEKKIVMNKEEFFEEDISQISLVSPAHSISVHDSDISANSSSLSSQGNTSEKIKSSEYEDEEENETEQGQKNEDEISANELEDFETENVKRQFHDSDDFKQKSKEKLIKDRFHLGKTRPEFTNQSKLFYDEVLRDINVDVLFKNGNRYQGRLSCYMMEGEATYKWSDGTTYQGPFTDGIAEGLGLIKWPDGSWYDGEIKCNRRHGRGISIYKQNGDPKMCYFGNWKNGRTNGKGMLIYGENNWYDGYWKKGLHDGFGLRQYPSGSRYLGEWKDGKENGWGTMVWSNHDMYTGSWINGKMDGKGTYSWRCIRSDNFVHPMQNMYIGQWKNGMRHGHGSLLLANGVVIHAFWANGIKEGPGQIICKNGIVIESSDLFKDDKIYKLGSPIMIPFWNTWYCEFLSSYRSGLFYVQTLEENNPEDEKLKHVGEITPEKYNECSNNIPIFAPVESLPLWDFVLKAVCQPIPDLTGKIRYYIRIEDVELLSSEEVWLRKVITNRMADIVCLYQHYATVACARAPPFKACMFRIMLWQMCRDCGLEETSFNLCQLDHETGCDSYPFAIILVFQMIHYLLVLTYEICVKKRKANSTIPGRLGGAFDYFLTNHALPGMQSTNRIPELCNTIPLKNVFCLYKSIGMPVTLGKIFGYLFPGKDTSIEAEEKPMIKISAKINGQNKIYPDGRIVFEEVGGSLLGTVFDFQNPGSKYFDLNDIRLLGKRELAQILLNVCPKAKNGNIPNSDYEVSFLEFCEFVKTAIRKYDSFIDPNTEVTLVTKLAKCDLCKRWVKIEDHYELKHKMKGEAASELEEKEITTVGSDPCDVSSTLSGESNTSTSTNDSETSDVFDKGNEISTKKDNSYSCKNREFIQTDEDQCTKLCQCEKSCECSCNELRTSNDSESFDVIEHHSYSTTENSIISAGVPFKDAKTVTLTACDSDCPCFCHEKSEYTNEQEQLVEEEHYEGSDNEKIDSKEISLEEESEDTMTTVNLSDAINYLCDISSEEVEEEYERNMETSSDGESTVALTDLNSELEEEVDNELCESWSSDDLLSGEDFFVTTKKFLSDLERIEASKDSEVGQKICEKLLEFTCPKFKIKYSEIFKKISTRGMTPLELREKLELDDSEDPFEEQEVEDIENQLVDESLKVIRLVSKQRLYEKLLIGQFKKTISQIGSGEYWQNFVENVECKCACKNCVAGICEKVRQKIKIAVGEDEYEMSSDSSVSVI